MSALVCGLGLWATMVLSARMMLSESILNFPLIIVMGVVLMAIFLVICGHFKSLLIEFESSFYFIEVILFAIIPLLSSVIISWFLCVEIPSLSLPFCFSTCYSLYTVWLVAPRGSSHPSSATANSFEKTLVFALPFAVAKAVYAIPVIVSPLLYIALCHNVTLTSTRRLADIAVTCLYPLLCMLMCAEQHIDYRNNLDENDRKRVKLSLSDQKLAISALLFLFLQNHPVLDDLKSLSGLPKSLASMFLCGAALLGSVAVYLHRYIVITSKDEMDRIKVGDSSDGIATRLSMRIALPNFAFSVAAGLTGECIFLFLGYNHSSLLLGFAGGIFFTDFYRFSSNYKWTSIRSIALTYFAILVTIIAVRFMLLDFLFRTVIYMTFSLDWLPNPMTMPAYCGRICDLFSLAATAPTFAMGLNDHVVDSKSDSRGLILPVGAPSPSTSPRGNWTHCNTVKGLSFSMLLLAFTFSLSSAELVIREQVQ